ncbi:MAG: protein-glutamate O-methyltransferase CheR [bacterium]|nr:protein-glutamate O-methyltransferase CheR [bacterium]
MVAVKASQVGHLPEKDRWAFEALKELLIREKGFDLEAYKERCILRRIYLKVRSKGHADLGSYYRELSRDREELERLFQYMTINVTEFFRNPTAFAYLERSVLPRLVAEHSVYGHFRVWSAGCSSGEEPYSLAIVLLRAKKRHRIQTPFTVLATDVDDRILARGKVGRYGLEALKNLEDEDIREYFVEEEGSFSVSDEVRERVTFRTEDILRDNPVKAQSLVVCRNLLIYFSRENQERVISGFSRKLHPGGFLMLGKAETLIGRNRLFFQSISPTERIYRLRDMPLADGNVQPGPIDL